MHNASFLDLPVTTVTISQSDALALLIYESGTAHPSTRKYLQIGHDSSAVRILAYR